MKIFRVAGVFALLACAAAPLHATDAPVVSGHARFTVLTPRVIRMEYSPTAQFEDAPSLVFATRGSAPDAKSTVSHEKGWLVIRTDVLTLRYKEGSGAFTADNLGISSKTTKPAID